MKASVLTEYRKLEWLEVPEPAISDSEVLIKVHYAGICGSDMHVFDGEFHPRTSTPLIMGHEFGGTIVAAGGAVKNFKAGDRVAVDPIYWCGRCPACQLQHFPACTSLKLLGIDSDGGFGQFVAAREFMLFKLDDSISDRHAALVEVLAIGFHACNRAGVQAGDSLAIFGTGRIGQCILQATRTITRGKIFMVDIHPQRLARARGAYEDIITINAREQDPVEAIREQTGGRGVDIAIEAVGHAEPLAGQPHPVAQSVEVIRGAGTVCVLGMGTDPVPLIMKRLIMKEARLIASRVTHGEFSRAIEHMKRGELKPDALVSCELPVNQAQQAFEMLHREPERHLKVLLQIP